MYKYKYRGLYWLLRSDDTQRVSRVHGPRWQMKTKRNKRIVRNRNEWIAASSTKKKHKREKSKRRILKTHNPYSSFGRWVALLSVHACVCVCVYYCVMNDSDNRNLLRTYVRRIRKFQWEQYRLFSIMQAINSSSISLAFDHQNSGTHMGYTEKKIIIIKAVAIVSFKWLGTLSNCQQFWHGFGDRICHLELASFSPLEHWLTTSTK